MGILAKGLPYLVSLISGCVLVVCTYKINRTLRKRDELIEAKQREAEQAQKDERERQQHIADGVQSLLRMSIINDYNKYEHRDSIPIYARENLEKTYSAYHALGGNDVATRLYQTIIEMRIGDDE